MQWRLHNCMPSPWSTLGQYAVENVRGLLEHDSHGGWVFALHASDSLKFDKADFAHSIIQQVRSVKPIERIAFRHANYEYLFNLA